MTKLSDTQLVVLSAACQRPDRSVYPLTAKLPGGAAAKVLGSLLKRSLVQELPAKREDIVWREDKKRGRLTLRATPAAFKALGVDEAPAEGEAETASSPEVEPESSSPRKGSRSKPKARGTRADSKQAHCARRDRRRPQEKTRPRGRLRKDRGARTNLSHPLRGAM